MSLLNDQFYTIYDMDKDFALKLAGILESSTVELIEKLQSSIKSTEQKKCKDILHTIKGSAANFGAEALMLKTREVEQAIFLLNNANQNDYLKQVEEINSIFLETLQKIKSLNNTSN